MSEADDRYLGEVREDLARVLGRGVDLLAVETEEHSGLVRLLARYRLADRVWESEAMGPNLVAAHGLLRRRLLVDRVRFGFTAFVDRP